VVPSGSRTKVQAGSHIPRHQLLNFHQEGIAK
jgi:hypothetical protein